ncbi:ABC transporter substrate-binding protein [Longispora sp. NPDC051575]|uniref:ABC transporter substrate-binding protein n=1 Tax=Longispora sp. NPDC051575 TaxID=3154943 RepID=UPI0034486F99
MTRRRDTLPAFDGAAELMELLGSLYAPPPNLRWRRWRRRMPVVHLVRGPANADLLDRVKLRFSEQIPTARLQLTADDGDNLRAVLAHLVELLAGARASGGRLRFRRHQLVEYLLQPLPQDGTADAANRDRLRRRLVRWLGAVDQAKEAVPKEWLRVLVGALITPATAVAAALIGRFGRHARWLTTQPYLNPAGAAGLTGFSRQLGNARHVERHPVQVEQLLVAAFLADLSAASTRRLFGWTRPRWRRRPVALLIDDLTSAPVGPRLLQALLDERRAALGDPLLLLVADTEPLAEPPGELAIAAPALRQQLDNGVQGQEIESLSVPDAAAPVTEVPFTLRERRLWPGWVWPAVAGVLVVALLGGVGGTWFQDRRTWSAEHCGLAGPVGGVDVLTVGRECVGVSDGSYPFVNDLDLSKAPASSTLGVRRAEIDRLRTVQTTIGARNAEIVGSGRAYVTIVHMTAISVSSPSGALLKGAREELEGVAVAQRELVESGTPIRVLIANAGYRMGHAPRVADLVVALTARRGVVAVTGMGQSLAPTKVAMGRLQAAGLPMVGSVTSDDELPTLYPLYHQVGPANRREATVAAAFAKVKLQATTIRVYASGDPADTYSDNLARDAEEEFAKAGLTVELPGQGRYRTEAAPTLPLPTAAQRGIDACGSDSLPFFAGREAELSEFLSGLSQSCPSKRVRILAGDDATRFVLDGKLAGFPNVELRYMSFASSAALATGGGLTGCQPARFYQLYQELFSRQCDDALDGRALIGRDAVLVIAQAVSRIQANGAQIPVSPGEIRWGIWRIGDPKPFVGASGLIDYAHAPTGQVPRNKVVLVMLAQVGQPRPTLEWQCGTLDDAHPAARGCPVE